jgi:poly-gamma-glutamate capsule biosynthesis protein CapA/YwtB (metallophosphatase superfamily)
MRRVWFALFIPCALATLRVAVPSVVEQSDPPAVASASSTTQPIVTIAAVGDTMLGSTPHLPPHPATYLRPITDALAAPITFGNLEGTLTTATQSKCGYGSANCFAFRDPPRYARYLHHAGFDILNSANNHSHDFGRIGLTQTTKALHAHGIAQTGLKGQITILQRNGIRVAFLGFAPYPNLSNLLDLQTAAAMVKRATTKADVIVVYMHAGAEGADKTHVTRHEEFAFGEDRGNPFRFAHMAVDNGADLVIASGPHVERGMQFYHQHLIAYSMGNFANFHNFNADGVLAYSCVLRVTLTAGGGFERAKFVSVKLQGPGRAFHDPYRASAAFVNRLSRQDFGAHAAHIAADGSITKP